MKKFVLLSFLAVLAFGSCDFVNGERVKGNGNIITRDQSVGKFHSVDVGGAIEVYLKQDSAGQSVKVETDENLFEFLEIREDNGVLYISPRNNFNLDPSNDRIKVFVTAPYFRGLHVSGASNVRGENKLTSSETFDIDLSGASGIKLDIKAPRVNAEISGASSINLAGETKDFNIEGSGASEVRCFDLLSENTTIDVSGAFQAEVYASVQLDVEASGASEVKYKGSPAVKQNTSGASNINKVN